MLEKDSLTMFAAHGACRKLLLWLTSTVFSECFSLDLGDRLFETPCTIHPGHFSCTGTSKATEEVDSGTRIVCQYCEYIYIQICIIYSLILFALLIISIPSPDS